jgi:hypothetical protein
MCIPLCNKHKGFYKPKRTEREEMTMYYECEDCNKVKEKWQHAAMRIESRLWHELCKKFGW